MKMTTGKVEFLHRTTSPQESENTGYSQGDIHTHVTNNTFPSNHAKDSTNHSARAGLSGAEQTTAVGYYEKGTSESGSASSLTT